LARNWSKEEVRATVEDYFCMLGAELAGASYSKTSHRRALSPRLESRSHSSIERKHQNISAVLIEMGLPYISGYKPLRNYQSLLGSEVESYLRARPELLRQVEEEVERPAQALLIEDYLSALVEPPKAEGFVPGMVKEPAEPTYRPRGALTNYLEREARNRSLGLAGEEFVLGFERERLARMGDGGMADRVEHVSETLSDWAGFDIRSFDAAGRDLFIEVKTTRFGKQTPFFLSLGELGFSRSRRDSYGLYRLFNFRRSPRLFILPGAVDERCALEPATYRAWPP
jgi:hypothetical protein